MYLKSIELTNFQKHSSLQLDFSSGINVLVGSSQAGKSCIRRAIEWCLFNASIDGIRKEGTKKTSVRIELDNGTVIERTRSSSINRYTLLQNGEEKIFDSIGKVLPEEIRNAIGIKPIEIEGEELWLNSAHQIALPFLFDKSPSWRMKLFNQLTGNDLLDKLFSQFNKDLLRISREHKTNSERIKILDQQAEEKEIEKEQLEAIHESVKSQLEEIRIKQKTHDNYMVLLTLQQINKLNTETLTKQKSAIKFPEDVEIERLRINLQTYDTYKSLLNAVLSNDKLKASIRATLSKIIVPTLNGEEIQGKIDRITMLETVKKRQYEANNKKVDILEKIEANINDVTELTAKLDGLLESVKECPTCGQTITEECKKELKNE